MRFDAYIKKIVSAIEGTPKEIADLTLELTTYLTDKRDGYHKNGASLEAASQQAIDEFGEPNVIGSQLSGTFFPLRKWSLSLLLIFSIIYFLLSIFLSLDSIKDAGTPYVIWTVLSLLVIAGNVLFHRKKLLIARFRTFFIVHCLLSLITVAYTLILYFDVPNQQIGGINRAFIISYVLIIISNMIIGALVKPIHPHFTHLKKSLRLTVIASNTISGMIVISYLCIFGLGFLIFGPAGNSIGFFLTPLLLLVAWVASNFLNNYADKTFCSGIIIQVLISLYTIQLFG